MCDPAGLKDAQAAVLSRIGSLQTVFWSTLLVILLSSIINRLTGLRYPTNLPRIREKDGKTQFSFRTRLSYYTDAKAMFHDAYEQYSKKGKTCLIPGLGFRSEVIIPGSAIRWMTSQPDSVLSFKDSALDLDQFEYSVGHRRYVEDGWQGTVLKRDLNSNLETVAPDVWDETGAAVSLRFGEKQNGWEIIHLYDTMKMTIAQASSRFTVSKPLCRDETYLRHSVKYADWFVIEAGLIGILPKSFRPFFGPIFALPLKYHEFFVKRSLETTIDQRMKLMEHPPNEAVPEPVDHLQMMMRYAQKDRPEEFNHDGIAMRVAISNIGSIHQTSVAITNTIFNVLESDSKYNTIALIRSEFANFFTSDDSKWTKANIAKMYRLDSIIRETLRINSFGNRGVMRQVMVDNLVTEDGFLLPKGAEVSLLAHPAQTDPDLFPNPDEFDPFRFSRPREAAIAKNSGENTSQNAFVSTGATHLAFGHGKHACPGRFILDFELKMLLCCVFGRYDLKLPEAYKGKRPPVKWVAEAQMLPSWGDILVKRREDCLC